jgi:hypothetical protein
MKGLFQLLLAVALCLFIPLSGWAVSSQMEVLDEDYSARDIRLTGQDTNHFYSSGLDVVRINGVRHFLVLWNTNPAFPPNSALSAGNGITLSLYDYNGNLVMDLATYKDPLNEDGDTENDIIMWPQTVKIDPGGTTIWFSYTASDQTTTNASDWICTVPWDPSLAAYPATPTVQFEHLGNWEIEWSTDSVPGQQGGNLFLSGLISSYNNGIYLYWHDGQDWQKQLVIQVGSSSAGFAFDNQGNLWYGSVLFTNNRIYMWTAVQVDDAADSGIPLNTGDATVAIPAPELKLKGNDVECDGAGNVYLSLDRNDTYHQALVRLENNGVEPWPDSPVILGRTQPTYLRTLAFDETGDLSSGQGLLFVDMDQGAMGVTPPTLVEISSPVPHSVPAFSPALYLLLMIPLSFLGMGALHKRKDTS